jgi:hypothetical protein
MADDNPREHGKANPAWATGRDAIRENHDNPELTEHSSKETLQGREGFTGGENLSNREEFAGRPDVTEQRQDLATGPNEPASEPVEGETRQ